MFSLHLESIISVSKRNLCQICMQFATGLYFYNGIVMAMLFILRFLSFWFLNLYSSFLNGLCFSEWSVLVGKL